MGGRRGGVMKLALGGVARGMEASKGGAGGDGGLCATRGGGEAAQGGKSGVAVLTGVENRGGGGGAPWGEGDGRPQVEEWDQGELQISGEGGRWARNRQRGGAARIPEKLQVEDDWVD
ncbi:glycine-rich cell wall structural protein 1.8-like [Panicum virgatum]|uniref:glycine-rich cell wall structural protein 1.8-like n=1 Tax=Panicum virgatum TaxID=38727 RepID=UPI0019D5C37B|nr:glycine-rich cell wall structural protein 1.8-like [Panicum virgatum]